MILSAETATVYRAPNGRRYLRKSSAYYAAARARVRRAYPCECEAEVGYDCGQHTHEYVERRDALVARLARFYALVDRRAPRSAPTDARAPRCTAVLRSVHSHDRGRMCGRPARHVGSGGAPVCGLHEPAALAARIARVRYEPGSRR